METTEIIKKESLTVGDWLLTLIVTAIPLVGFIMLFVWAFTSGTPQSKSNWAKAMLLIIAISIVLSIIFVALFGAAFFGMMDKEIVNMQEY